MKIFLYIILLTSSIYASVAQISSLRGHSFIERGDKKIEAKVGFELEKKDFIITSKDAKVQIIFKDETIVTIGRSSTFSIYDYVFDEANSKKSKVDFRFFKGSFKSVTGAIGKIAPDKFKIRTKTATIGIRGTTIVGNQRRVACTYGRISITSHGITVVVPEGMYSETPPDTPPTQPTLYTPGDIGSSDVEESASSTQDDESATGSEDSQEGSESATNSEDSQDDEEPATNTDDSQDDEEPATNPDDSQDDDEQVADSTGGLDDTPDTDDTGQVVAQTENDVDSDVKEADEQEVIEDEEDHTEEEQTLDDLASPATTSNLDDTQIDTTDLTKESIYGDDYLDYGYWKDEDDVRVALYGSGVVTSSDYVDQMIQNGGTASYSGHLVSIVTKPDDTKVSSGGDINLDFDFSNQTFDGNINVTEGGFKAEVSGDVHRYGFDSTSVVKASGSTANITDGSLNGKFYGDQAQDVGGHFNLTSDNEGSVSGVFGIQKQP